MEKVGWLVTILFGVCYWPQIWHSYQRKSVGDISLLAWVLQALGYSIGISYGLWLKEAPLIFGYIHGLLCSVLFLIMYWNYRGNHVSIK